MPTGDPVVEVRRVSSFEEYRTAVELDWAVWQIPAQERDRRRSRAREHWRILEADGTVGHYLALVGGIPAGFARVVFTPWAAILMGGATLPGLRGRGVYTALVHARWNDAVARGTPCLTVAAGAMSAPILRRIGFRQVGGVRLFTDRL